MGLTLQRLQWGSSPWAHLQASKPGLCLGHRASHLEGAPASRHQVLRAGSPVPDGDGPLPGQNHHLGPCSPSSNLISSPKPSPWGHLYW